MPPEHEPTSTWEDLNQYLQKVGLASLQRKPVVVLDQRVRTFTKAGQKYSRNEVGVGVAVAIPTDRGPELMVVTSADSYPVIINGSPAMTALEMQQAHKRIVETYAPGLLATALEYTQSSIHGLSNAAHLNKPIFVQKTAWQLANSDLTKAAPEQLIAIQKRATKLGPTGHDVRHANHVLPQHAYTQTALPVLAAAGANGTKIWHAKKDNWGAISWYFNDGQQVNTAPTFLVFHPAILRLPGDTGVLLPHQIEVEPEFDATSPNMLLALGLLGSAGDTAALPTSVLRANQALEDRENTPLLDDTVAGLTGTLEMVGQILDVPTTSTLYSI